MLCQRCGKGEGEYQCKVCHKVIGEECVKTTPSGVYCLDDVPSKYGGESKETHEKAPKTGRGSKNLLNLFLVMLVLTVGLWLIAYISQYFLTTLGTTGEGQAIAQTLQDTADSIVFGLGVFTVIIGLGYAVTYFTSGKNEE